VLSAVAILELWIALVCFFSRRFWLQAGLVAWLTTNLLAYRVGLVLVHYHKPCSCLGSVSDFLHVAPHTVDIAMEGILTYLLVGSYASLLLLRQQSQKPLSPVQQLEAFIDSRYDHRA